MTPDQTLLADFLNKHPMAAAQVLEELTPIEVAEFMGKLPFENCQQLLELMNSQKAANCFMLLPQELGNRLMENQESSLAESICRELDSHQREILLDRLSPTIASTLRQKLEQAQNTVGMLMVPAIVVNKEMSVKDAIEIIKKNKEDREHYLHVVDSDGSFQGVIRLKELLLADKRITLEALMITKIPTFLASTPVKDVVNHPAWYEYRYIPVIGKSEKLLGTLPYRTTREVSLDGKDNSTKGVVETGKALGELYLVGLMALLQTVGK